MKRILWIMVLLCLLPAALACVTLLLRAGDEQTSTLRVLPLAAVVTALSFACAAGGAVAQPLKRVADDIRQRIYDTFFYTQPRDVFTLASEGWYPQGQGQLGGPADPDTDPVMVVITLTGSLTARGSPSETACRLPSPCGILNKTTTRQEMIG